MKERVYNFGSGPAVLPLDVLQTAAGDLVDYQGQGMGICEIGHRTEAFGAILNEAESLLRELLRIPANYKVLFLQGGASSQFYMVPMNLLGYGRIRKATYLNTGTWSKKAIAEARIFGNIDVAYSGEAGNFNRVPLPEEYTVSADSEYLYFVSNNTIYGTQFQQMPQAKTLVADMSSDILSRRIAVEDFGIIFAGAQKNMGPAGLTVVIIRDNLLDRVDSSVVPTMLRYKTHAENGSMFNTPPTWPIYILNGVLKWLKALGGIDAIEVKNRDKAALLYDVIDANACYLPHAEKTSRSVMNVTFRLPTLELEKKFLAEADAKGFRFLRGHRSVGGCRASLYNAFPYQGCVDLATFMNEFAEKNPV